VAEHELREKGQVEADKNDRAHVSRGLGEISRAGHFYRLQPDLFPAVRARLPRHAAPVSFLPGRIPGLARHVVGRRVDPRRRVYHPTCLLPLVVTLWSSRWPQPVGRQGSGMADRCPTTHGQLCADAHGDGRGICLWPAGGVHWLSVLPPWPITLTISRSSTRLPISACGSFC